MPSRVAAICCVALALLTIAGPAQGWIENHVLGEEVRIVVDPAGKAVVEHRVRLKTNGSERLRELRLHQVARDAVPEDNSYVVPAQDALSNSLDSATPLSMELRHPKSSQRGADAAGPPAESRPAELRVQVDGDRGLRRGVYVFVVRYRTDLRARGVMVRDGSMVEIRFAGAVWEDGFDNARTIFVVPASPTPPRAVDELGHEGGDDPSTLTPRYLSEVRRGTEVDEVELLRSFAPKGESITWVIRADPRAFDPLPAAASAPAASRIERGVRIVRDPVQRAWWIGGAAVLFLLFTLMVLLKAWQAARHAREARAELRPWIPLPLTLRAVAAGAALVGGVALQLLLARPVWGSALVLVATALTGLGAARVDQRAAMRGPGRWLTVSESEALGPAPRPTGAWLDSTTRAGMATLLCCLAAVGGAAYLASLQDPLMAALVGLDSVVLLAVFGTGRLRGLPPDPMVEPIRFYRRLLRRFRRMKAGRELRVAPRIRIPAGQIDPDELRLLIVPRLPRRGFGGIEIGMTYVLGFGARVGMPEVLLRVVKGSPCDEAVARLSRHARISPGRKADERVLAFAPRLPTVGMTAEIAVALAASVTDHEAPQRRAPEAGTADAPEAPPTKGKAQAGRQRKRRAA